MYITVLVRLGPYRASGELHRDLLLEHTFHVTLLLRGDSTRQRGTIPAAEDVALAFPVTAVTHSVHAAPSELLWLKSERLERLLVMCSHQ